MKKQGRCGRAAGQALFAAAVVVGASAIGTGSALAQQGQMRGDAEAKAAEHEDHGLIARALRYTARNSYIRLGALHLSYEGSSTPLRVDNPTGLAAQAFGTEPTELQGTGSAVGDLTTLGGTYGLYLPWTGRHLAFEVTLAPPLELDFEVSGSAIDQSLAPETRTGINTGVSPLGQTLGTFKALPPNFTIVFRPWVDTILQPYVGAGAMYLYTYDTQVMNEELTVFGNEPVLNLTKPIACVGQAGMDVKLPGNFFLTADAKYIGCAEIEATLNDVVVDASRISPTFGPVEVGSVSTTNKFEALLYQLSIGYHF